MLKHNVENKYKNNKGAKKTYALNIVKATLSI